VEWGCQSQLILVLIAHLPLSTNQFSFKRKCKTSFFLVHCFTDSVSFSTKFQSTFCLEVGKFDVNVFDLLLALETQCSQSTLRPPLVS